LRPRRGASAQVRGRQRAEHTSVREHPPQPRGVHAATFPPAERRRKAAETWCQVRCAGARTAAARRACNSPRRYRSARRNGVARRPRRGARCGAREHAPQPRGVHAIPRGATVRPGATASHGGRDVVPGAVRGEERAERTSVREHAPQPRTVHGAAYRPPGDAVQKCWVSWMENTCKLELNLPALANCGPSSGSLLVLPMLRLASPSGASAFQ